jgi:hypothetical protein
MRLPGAVRRFPLSCLLVTAGYLLRGRIRRGTQNIGQVVTMAGGERFIIFRHLTLQTDPDRAPAGMPVLVARFRFARGSQKINRWASLLPVPLIVGFPGFREKVWMSDADTGYWQGVYQWESDAAAEEYRKSFVLAVMNRRAARGTVSCRVVTHGSLSDYISRASRCG